MLRETALVGLSSLSACNVPNFANIGGWSQDTCNIHAVAIAIATQFCLLLTSAL